MRRISENTTCNITININIIQLKNVHTHTHTHTHTHKRGVNPTGQPSRGTPWVMLMSAVLQLASVITRKVLNEKIFYYSVLESSRDNLQAYAMKNKGFHLKN